MASRTESITYQRLRDVIVYNKDTGTFRWRQNRRNVVAGEYAGYVRPTGYRAIGIDGKDYRAHRLAWLYVYGSFPKGEIDHINGKKDDNRIDNLRNVNHRANLQNQVRHRNGKLVGCYYYKSRDKWHARIRVGGKHKHLGYYDTEEEGHRAYMGALGKLVC